MDADADADAMRAPRGASPEARRRRSRLRAIEGEGAAAHRVVRRRARAALPAPGDQMPSTRLRWMAYSPSAIVSQAPMVRSASR